MWQQTIVKLMAFSVVGGAVCGVFGDFLEILRIAFLVDSSKKFPKTHRVTLFFHDLLFGLFCGCTASVILYYGNEGRFRIFSIFGAAAGFAAYKVSVSVLLIAVVKKLVGFLHKAIHKSKSFLKTKFIRIKHKLKERKEKNKEAVKIERNQNCKLVGDKGRGKRAFHKSQPRTAVKRKKSA